MELLTRNNFEGWMQKLMADLYYDLYGETLSGEMGKQS